MSKFIDVYAQNQAELSHIHACLCEYAKEYPEYKTVYSGVGRILTALSTHAKDLKPLQLGTSDSALIADGFLALGYIQAVIHENSDAFEAASKGNVFVAHQSEAWNNVFQALDNLFSSMTGYSLVQ